MYSLKSLKTDQLTKNIVNKILKIKDQTWKYGLISQKKYFNSTVKKKDIHNLLFFKSNLIGYTLLNKKNIVFNNKKIPILYLDSLVISVKFRGKRIANLLMNFNNKIILDYNYFCILSCDKKMVSFYKKFFWSKINKNKKFVKSFRPNLIKMCFNKEKLISYEKKEK